MRDNMKKLAPVGVLALMIALLLAIVVPAMAGGPHNKATGAVTWTARTHLPPSGQIPGIVSSFDVHDDAPGAQSDRGTYETIVPASDTFPGGAITLDVKCVNVADGEAWFAGTVESASGGYSGSEGDVFLYWIQDVGTPGSAGPDLIGGMPYATIGAACAEVDDVDPWTGSGVVTDGNLKVFHWDS